MKEDTCESGFKSQQSHYFIPYLPCNGTKITPPKFFFEKVSSSFFSNCISYRLNLEVPMTATMTPLTLTCLLIGSGRLGAAAERRILSKGAYSFSPIDPSPKISFTFLSYPDFSKFSFAN